MLQDICTFVGAVVLNFCRVTGQMMLLFLDTLSKVREVSIKEMLRQMALLGADSLPIVLLTMLCTGMVFSVQTAKEFVALGASGTVGGIVAIAMGRELVPVLTGVVVAGRIGAAIAAELGTMKVTEQIDALRVMATSPVQYLVVPRFLAIAMMMPVLVVFGNFIGNAGGYFVAHYYADIGSMTYLNSIRQLCVTFDVVGGMIKGVVFGAIISIVGCFKGLNAKQGAEGVGLATTASVVLSIILIFIFDYFLTAFGEKKVLQGVDLEVKKGETMAVIGPSGTGKSTILKVLIGLLEPTGGKVCIEGQDVSHLTEEEWNEIRKHIGMVFQYSALFDFLDVGENVAFGLRQHFRLQEEEIRQKVDELLQDVGMLDAKGMYPVELSGGMKKRVSLARALAFRVSCSMTSLRPDWIPYA